MEKDKTGKAISYSYRLLTLRPRSEKELRGRLLRKRFNRVTVENVISILKEKNIIDDVKFARRWIESRMNTSPKGSMFLRKELRDKGVPASVIDGALSETKAGEGSVARALAGEKMKKLTNLPREEAKRKLFGFLARRGFSYDVVKSALEEL
jgi:regulatory protein